MANRTNASIPYDSYEYYLDYLDLIPVDEKKLKANKHLVVIAFWVSLAAFVVLLFLILLYMSWSGPLQVRNHPQHHQTCPWSHILNLPLWVRGRPTHPRGSLGSSQVPSPVEEPGCRGSAPDQQLEREGAPSPPRPTRLSSGN
ncbi:melanocortin-2 receptor accessory protein [Choloepus didactylus]|uniref:melanocortin-2 receptor accessory protein n=1 Tax=Choloepus didactylus TaxID=27675 RepID=UPI0018A0D455|nr:melanocortin-2 receptor accessory protein [Choloepus didactylus]